MWWIWLSLRRDYNVCGVAWRILLRVRSRCVSSSLSLRSFLLRFGLSVGVGSCSSSSVGESNVSAQSVRFSCLCLCDSRFSRGMLSFSCLSGTLMEGFPVPRYSCVSNRPSLLGDPWYPPTCPLNTCFVLLCYCLQGVKFISTVLGCSCVHCDSDVCSMTGGMFTVVCVPSGQVSDRVLLCVVALLVVYSLSFA